MHDRFSVALGGVQWHEWIGEVVAEHPTRVRCLLPFFRRQQIDCFVIPFLASLGGTAPIVLIDVQDMILKITKRFVRRFSAHQVFVVVFEQQLRKALATDRRYQRQ